MGKGNHRFAVMILKELLHRYEDSEWFRTGSGSRRVFLPERTMRSLQEQMEKPDTKADILETLKRLSEQNLLFYSWEKYEEGNLLSKIWLNTDQVAISESYRLSGMPDGHRSQTVLLEQLDAAIRQLRGCKGDIRTLHRRGDGVCTDLPLIRFLETQTGYIRQKKKIPRYFTGDETKDRELLECICFLGQNSAEISERVLSTRLYGDSKALERSVRSRVLSCLRAVQKAEGREDLRDDELLQLYGVVRWPEVMEFCGDVSIVLDDGTEIPYASSRYGAYINSDTISHIQAVRLGTVHKVLFIENKANYVWYVQQKKKPDELVLFHGGFYSPAKGKWFSLIYEAGNHMREMVAEPELTADVVKEEEMETGKHMREVMAKPDLSADPVKEVKEKMDVGISWQHWSDIDIGGFRIFRTLRDQIVPELVPYRMDEVTLREADLTGKCMSIQSASYRNDLQEMMNDPAFSIFHKAIRYMLDEGVRLEQEQLIV